MSLAMGSTARVLSHRIMCLVLATAAALWTAGFPQSRAAANTVAPKLPKGAHRPKQELGQSYLSDPNTAAKIVSTFSEGAAARCEGDYPRVVELGPGLGALTRSLVAQFPRMLAVDVDPRAVNVLRQDLPSLQVWQEDLLKLDHADLARKMGGRLSVIGNLPYSITTDALLSLVASPGALRYAVVMIQKEAAERVVASPGSKDYSPLSVMLQIYARPRMRYSVPRTAFYPKPKVTSAIVEFDFPALEELPEVSAESLLEIVKTSFCQRKKTLKHSLKSYVQERRMALPLQWSKLRAEQLSPEQFVALARQLARPGR